MQLGHVSKAEICYVQGARSPFRFRHSPCTAGRSLIESELLALDLGASEDFVDRQRRQSLGAGTSACG